MASGATGARRGHRTIGVIGGIGPESTVDYYRGLIAEYRAGEHADALILGATELPLLLRGHEVPGLPFIDTARVHAKAAVARVIAATPA